MNLKKLAEPLEISDIDFRIKTISLKGYAIVLAYKDARVDQRRLDEVVGAENWQKDYKVINNNLFCGIGIKCDQEWVWKWDVGIESNTEKEKGEASDAQKRAGFAWGIGRELYDYPFIGIQLNPDEFKVEGGKAKQEYSLRLNNWAWDSKFEGGKLVKLTAVDTKGVVRFKYDTKPSKTTPPNPRPVTPTHPDSNLAYPLGVVPAKITDTQWQSLQDLYMIKNASLTTEQKERAKAIISKKEEASYQKLNDTLRGL